MRPAARSRCRWTAALRPETAPRVIEAGADTLVAGTAVFGAPDYAAAIAALRGEGRPGERVGPAALAARCAPGDGAAAEPAHGPRAGRSGAACARSLAGRSGPWRTAVAGRTGIRRRRARAAARRRGVMAPVPPAAGRVGARLHLAARSAGAGHRCGHGCARARWWPNGSRAPPGEALAHRPDVAGARITAWLGHYDFFAASAGRCVPPEADGAPGLRRPQPVRGPAGRGAGCAGADRAEGPDRRGGGAARACRLPDPRAALPAAGDRPAGAAGRLPRRAQSRRPARRIAGPDRDPRPAAGGADPAAACADQRDRADGAGAADDAPWRRRSGAVQRQQGGEQQPDRHRVHAGGSQRTWSGRADRWRLPSAAGRPQRADRRLRRAAAGRPGPLRRTPALCRWSCRSGATA